MTSLRRSGFLSVCILMMVGLVGSAGAQFSQLTFINYHETTPQDDALQLDIFFNITDSNRQVLTDADVESVIVEVDDGQRYEASVAQANSPFYIALVLDASGSMTAANADMRAAASAAVDDAPENARFAVYSFSEQVYNPGGFTADVNSTLQAINGLRSVPNGGTCLYDAAMRAVTDIAQQPGGRRAVILFTDGVDEDAQGNVCSRSTLSQVVDAANQRTSPIPLHVIGMQGDENINQSGLQRMADDTGGFARFGNRGNLTSLFDSIMLAISNQWAAQVDIYPTQGRHVATITPVLRGDIRASSTQLTFEANRTYDPPFNASFTEIQYDEGRDVIRIRLQAIGSGRVQSLDVVLQNEETGLTDYRQTYQTLPDVIEIAGQANGLIPGNDYLLRISGLAANGTPLLEEPIEQSITYAGPETEPVVEPSVRVMGILRNEAAQTVTATLSALGANDMDTIRVQLVDNRTGEIVGATTQAISPTSDQATISLAALEPGVEYTFQAMPYNAQGRALMDEHAARVFTNGVNEPPVIRAEVVHQPGTEAISIDLTTGNADRVASLRVTVFSGDENVRVVNPFIVNSLDGFDITDQMLNLPMGEYRLDMMPLDGSEDELFAEPVSTEFSYIPPQPGFLARIANFLRSPIIAALLIVAFLFFGNYLYQRRKSKQPDPRKKQAGGAYGGTTRVTPNNNPITLGRDKKMDDRIKKELNNPTGNMTANLTRILEDDLAKSVAQLTILESESHRDYQSQSLFYRIPEANFPYQMGRKHQNNDLNFPLDNRVSREHLIVDYDNGTFYLEDISMNGVRMNGHAIPQNKRIPVPAGEKDILLEFGRTVKIRLQLS